MPCAILDNVAPSTTMTARNTRNPGRKACHIFGVRSCVILDRFFLQLLRKIKCTFSQPMPSPRTSAGHAVPASSLCRQQHDTALVDQDDAAAEPEGSGHELQGLC